MYIQNPGRPIIRDLGDITVIIPNGRRRFDAEIAERLKRDPIVLSLHNCGSIVLEADLEPEKSKPIVKSKGKKKKD